MVTGERKLLTIEEAERIINESRNRKEMVTKLRKLPKRQKAPPPPDGGISIREAARKYGLSNVTIWRWVNNKFIPVILETKNTTYIDESRFAEIASSYNSLPKGTRKTIKNAISLVR